MLQTGYRFNGEGFVAIDGRSFNVLKQSDIQMSFKTFAEDGLLFVAYGDTGRASQRKRDTVSGHRIVVEMKGGQVIYQVREYVVS